VRAGPWRFRLAAGKRSARESGDDPLTRANVITPLRQPGPDPANPGPPTSTATPLLHSLAGNNGNK